MRALALLAILLGLACDRAPDAAPASALPAAVYRGLPDWAVIPQPGTKPARPQPWRDDGRPTLVMFTASWCPSCPASLWTEKGLAHAYDDRVQVGIGLVEESDDDFASSTMAQLLGDVPVWSARSVNQLARRCDARAIPLACLIDHGRVVFRGHAISAPHVLDAYLAGQLDATRAADAAARAAVAVRLSLGIDAATIDALVAATHHDPGWQSDLAWRLASPTDAPPAAVALALALARDAVTAEGGLDYAHLDTFALALSKAGFPEDAALVSWRLLAMCSSVHAKCLLEKRRAYGFIYYARETGHRWH